MGTPQISVLMTVYNGQTYIRQAVESILAQTFRDFELVVVDDGSDDDTWEILRGYDDPRLRLLKGEHAGLTAALNRGGAQCRGEFIARMDADDVAYPERLQVEFDYLAQNPEMGLVCADAVVIDGDGAAIGAHRMGAWDDGVLRQALLFRARAMPVIHPSVMMRREVFEALGGYRDFVCAEDHDFWLRAMEDFRFGHCAQPLLFYRVHPKGVSRAKRATQAAYGVMSVVAHLVDVRARTDLFARHPELFRRFLATTQAALAQDFLPCESAFLEIRRRIKSWRALDAAVALANALPKYGLAILPFARMRTLRRLSERLAADIQRELADRETVGARRANKENV